MALSSPPPDPPSSTAPPTTATGTAALAPRIFTNPPPAPPAAPARVSQQTHHHYLYTAAAAAAQPYPYVANRVPSIQLGHPLNNNNSKSHHDPSLPQGILYPVASSGRGFLPIRPQSAADHAGIAVPNPPQAGGTAAALQPRPVVAAGPYPQNQLHPIPPFGVATFPNSDLIRPAHLHHSLLGSAPGMMPAMAKGVPASAHQKVAPSHPSIYDGNGYKDLRDRSRDDRVVIVRDREVRIYDGSSLYALCRSWMRNGFPEESQPQYVDGVKSLPKPSPTPVADSHSPTQKEGDKEEEEESFEHLSPADLLQRHIKRAKRVRAQLREERLHRIARYKTRLALLLPPLVDQQQFRNDTVAGN
ncbi:protein transport protein SEC31-like [Diospyros lotus]|uniref:protein transport protein SEC31-like n=1 Tax=Diospyros lotus TaxID=55363 RepID=UPI00225A2399|nr:protein transport protein SEC31-like [Diospyros lotus]